MTLRSGLGCQTSSTASQTSSEYSGSVPVKLSGEYSKRTSVSGSSSTARAQSFAPSTAISVIPARSSRKTTRRWSSDVEL